LVDACFGGGVDGPFFLPLARRVCRFRVLSDFTSLPALPQTLLQKVVVSQPVRAQVRSLPVAEVYFGG
jgi:hypothetical protein